MRRVLILFVLLAVVATPLVAQGKVYFPSNAPSGGATNTFPFGNAFGDNWRYHGFLDATLLPSAKIKITDVAVAPQANGTFTANPFQVRMAMIPGSLTSLFGQNLGPAPIELYNGPIKLAVTTGVWNDLGMQTSFGYDGDRTPKPNIALEIRYRNRTAGFRCFSDGVSTMPRVWANNITTPTTPDPYTAVAGRLSTSGGIRICLTYARTCICDVALKLAMGKSHPVSLIYMPPNDFYQIAASLGQGPLDFGTCHIGLSLDPILLYSIQFGTPIFNGYVGVVPTSGSVTGKFSIPSNNALIGITVYHAAVAYNKGGLTCCTNTEASVITP